MLPEGVFRKHCAKHGASEHEKRDVCLECDEMYPNELRQARLFREVAAIFCRDGGQWLDINGPDKVFEKIKGFYYKYVNQEIEESLIKHSKPMCYRCAHRMECFAADNDVKTCREFKEIEYNNHIIKLAAIVGQLVAWLYPTLGEKSVQSLSKELEGIIINLRDGKE